MENNSTETQELKPMEFRITDPATEDFIKAIHWNKPELMAAIKERVAKYENIVYTSDNVKQAKADRAELNKLIKAIEDKRKEVKKQLLKPYEDFEAEVKELLEIIKKPAEMIDKQVKGYEQEQKAFKKSQLKTQFEQDSKAKALSGKVEFEDVFEERYLNATVSLASAWNDMSGKLAKIQEEISLIENKDSVHKHSVMSMYLKSFDITKALEHERQLEEMAKREEEEKAAKERAEAEAKQKAEEERLRQEAESKTGENENNVKRQIDGVQDRQPQGGSMEPRASDQEASTATGGSEEQNCSAGEDKIFPAAFRVCGTKEQLAMLVRFMNERNINWQQIPTNAIRATGSAA